MLISAFLVEDKPDIRDTLVAGMQEIAPVRFVGHAASEQAAKQWLIRCHDDWQIAIIDLFLAEGSGFGVLRDCQKRGPNQKVVVLTSYKHQNITDRCLQLGTDQVFDKSGELEELVAFCKAHANELNTGPPSLH